MMRLRPTFLFSILLLLTMTAAARHPIIQLRISGKPYQQWTAREAEQLLADSPWARTEVGLVSIGRTDPLSEVADTSITVRLRSAAPIREALARLDQIKNKYETRTPDQRAQIDARSRQLLECPDCADYYIVSMTVGPGSRKDLPAFLTAARSFESVKQNVFFENDKHERRVLERFIAPKFSAGEALFYFARRDATGNPLIGPDIRTVIISFDPRVFDWKKATPTKFKFDVARMIIDGKVAF